MITGVQLKAARELIGLSQLALAVQFQMGRREVANFEAGKNLLPQRTARHLQRAFEAPGLEFTNGDRSGVKLRKGK
jgi:transcriptional regulator with XRE-family HTH domain